MGIIKKFKEMFSNDIKPEPSKIVGLVYPYPLKGGQIKVNATVVVPKNYSFVIGYKGKALDCFNEGEYVLGPATLPECCKKLKIHKQKDNGSFKKTFKANVYFVKLGEYEYNFKTYDKAELGSRATGIFNVGMTGKIKVKIADAKAFVSALLYEYDYLKQNEAEKLVGMWTSELVVKMLAKYNFALSEFLTSNPIIPQNLKEEIGRKFVKLGIIIEDISNVKYILPKKYQKEYEENLAKAEALKNQQEENQQEQAEIVEESINDEQIEPLQNVAQNEDNVQEIQSQDDKDEILINQILSEVDEENNNSGTDIQPITTVENESSLVNDIQNKISNYQEKVNILKEEIAKNKNEEITTASKEVKTVNDEYVPFGNIVIEDVSNKIGEENVQKNNELQANNENVDEQILVENNNKITTKNSISYDKTNNTKEDDEPEFVDLNLDNLYNDEPKQGKRCEYCGFINDMDKAICEVCGTKLSEENYNGKDN